MDSILNQNIKEAAFTVVDVETTGLSAASNRIIELGLVRVENLKIKERFSTLINPQTDIPYFITSLTGITNEDVFDAPLFDNIINKLEKFSKHSILCGHNLSFDLSFLRNEHQLCGMDFNPDNTVCTLRIARKLLPDLKSRSLGPLSEHLKVSKKNSHRALGDAETTAKVLIKLINNLSKRENIKTVAELIDYQSGSSALRNLNVKPELQNDFYSLPNAPGIYYFTNKKDEVIYIGKAKSLRERVKIYFSNNQDRKTKKIIKQAARLKHIITNSELTALIAEAESIKLINPKHNKMLKGYGNKYFLRVVKTKNAPYLDIINNFDFDGNDYFGLFHSRRMAQSILEFINKTFAIRECKDKEYDKGKLCFLHDIKRCTGPCIQEPEKLKAHNEEFENVYNFLYGENQFAMNRLLSKMKEYSSKQKYEKAAEIKELIDFLLEEIDKSSLLAEPINKANALIEVISKFDNDFILLTEGKVFIKDYIYDKKKLFEEHLNEFYSNSIQNDMRPNIEDLEKLKITLNWIIRNRNRVKIYYLKKFNSKEELLENIGSNSSSNNNAQDNDLPDEPFYDYNI